MRRECCCKARGGQTHGDSNAVFVTLCPGRCTGRGGGGGMHAAVACLTVTLHSVACRRAHFSTCSPRGHLPAPLQHPLRSACCLTTTQCSPPPAPSRCVNVGKHSTCIPSRCCCAVACHTRPTPCRRRRRRRAKNAVTGVWPAAAALSNTAPSHS
jgi:hypothetical protein